MLEVFAYGGHGGHGGSYFWKTSCAYYSFIIKVMFTIFGAEIPTSHFGGHVGGQFWKKMLHINLL